MPAGIHRHINIEQMVKGNVIDIISENGAILPKHVVRISKRLYFTIIVCDQNLQ